MKIKFILPVFLIIAFLKVTAVNVSNSEVALPNQELADQTNLALRQTGHELLKISGDDSTIIAPVQQMEEHIFLLPIQQTFNYDTLPFLLHHALESMGMETESYYVSVKDCNADSIILGYDVRQFFAKNVPCIGRVQYSNCNHIYLTFPNRKTTLSTNYYWAFSLLIPVFIGWFYFSKKTKKAITKSTITTKSPEINPIELLAIGQSQLDLANQHLFINDGQKNLTFREAKLLAYFANHANQLLKREDILENVWEDEGIMVGRSLDVFVSRLRKILKEDKSLVIKTVHGVGYRLEVKE